MPTWQQNYTNSCGAASLLCAAHELGVGNFPGTATPIYTPAGENLIYQNIGDGKPETKLADRGYSMPAKIAVLARTFGLDVEVYLPPTHYVKLLTIFYNNAVEQARLAGVTVTEHPAPPTTGDGYRDLKVMAVMKILGLHYVMKRPNGQYMDPAEGADYADFDAMNNSFLKSYTDTGILIRLRRR